MKILQTAFPAILISSAILFSCNESKTKNESVEEPKVEATPVQPAMALDTVGVYQLTSMEAEAYIVKMNQVLYEMERAIEKNDPSKMPGLMRKVGEERSKQNAVQSNLSESDRALFKTYVYKIADKLDTLAARMENM